MKRKAMLGVAALAAVTAVGGSFAYFNQTMTAENPFDTGKYETTMEETFNPKDGENWQPGVTVEKKVGVKNTGDQPVVVRMSFSEEWKFKDKDAKILGPDSGNSEQEGKGNVLKVMNVYQESLVDGQVEKDDSVVKKNLIGENEKWVLGSDGWYYYVDVVPAGTTEPIVFLESVTLDKDLDMGKMETTFSYTWVEKNEDGTEKETHTGLFTKSECVKGDVKLTPGDGNSFIIEAETKDDGSKEDDKANLALLAEKLGVKKGDNFTTKLEVKAGADATGYSDADYALTVKTQTVQATDAAVKELFAGAFNEDKTAFINEKINWNLAAEALPTTPAN